MKESRYPSECVPDPISHCLVAGSSIPNAAKKQVDNLKWPTNRFTERKIIHILGPEDVLLEPDGDNSATDLLPHHELLAQHR